MVLPMFTAYLAPEGFEDDLRADLAGQSIIAEHSRLFIVEGEAIAAPWAANIWHDAQEHPIASIGAAAAHLKSIQRNWVPYAPLHHRRASLIQEKLPFVSAKPLDFGKPVPKAPLGAFTLLAPDRLLYAARTASQVPDGEWRFNEDREGPPNRAYLKLWEGLTRYALAFDQPLPGPGEACLDLGASPGGWTWVLAQLGAKVTAIDKAELAPNVAALPNVTWRQGSAFALEPKDEAPVDWLFSDIICYPMRLYKLVERWIAAGKAKRILCTLKFQGATDREAMAAFAAIPGGQLCHLHHNKHELTWMWRAPDN